MKLTVYFDGTYWCGLVEYEGLCGDYRATKYVFGTEPKNSEIEEFVHLKLQDVVDKNDQNLLHKNSTANIEYKEKRVNPKKMQRKINKEKNKPVLSTKAQLSMQESREQSKIIRKKQARQDKELQKKKKFDLKQEKKKEKKKGH
ncbi:YjdF family protein [Enterococcus sp. UD-01]|jgi:hypothetical protein|uniref:YjdF family protein n=1 Tax=Enterococcus sp. UD-01 TaxID=3373911 RepID=UPI003834F0D6